MAQKKRQAVAAGSVAAHQDGCSPLSDSNICKALLRAEPLPPGDEQDEGEEAIDGDGLLRDSLIVSCRPPIELPASPATASSASSSDGIFTKAKPRGRLVARSATMRTDKTRP